ncbi:hypothetical protein chiPu_0013631 [Chiloscyllium punctatum]|uniref:Uncharacterized protein n=1 Tax=Chiloscyllium punctatum TaxID=137246 RepID=A0A401SXL8_CHIPU|nr:hypothetical protein [Chiloscyllium punctatum]
MATARRERSPLEMNSRPALLSLAVPTLSWILHPNNERVLDLNFRATGSKAGALPIAPPDLHCKLCLLTYELNNSALAEAFTTDFSNYLPAGDPFLKPHKRNFHCPASTLR